MHIIVTDYDTSWIQKYNEESEKIKAIYGDEIIDIHHIGSTSVPGLKAKPIIDIMPVVRDINRIDSYNGEMETLGYECMGEFGMPGRRYFRKGGDHRTHQVHMFQVSNKDDIIRHIAVRDYLRKHSNDAYEYGQLKARLAIQFPNDIGGYSEGKDAFVKNLERKSLQWYRLES